MVRRKSRSDRGYRVALGGSLKLTPGGDEESRTGPEAPDASEVGNVKARLKFLLLGIVLGALGAMPLGFNIGREAPLMSNPFEERDLKDQVVERVKDSTADAIEDAREAIHDATKPIAQAR